MKARITEMKAPWPEGAAVESVVAFEAGAVPAWAVGKCVPVGDDVEADYTVSAPGAGSDVLSLESKLTAAERAQISEELHRIREDAYARQQALTEENGTLREQLDARAGELADLQAAHTDLGAKHATAMQELEALRSKANPLNDAEAQAQREKAAIAEKDALIKKAEAAGIKIDKRGSAEKIAATIAEAEKAAAK